jgi:hypothetical protein
MIMKWKDTKGLTGCSLVVISPVREAVRAWALEVGAKFRDDASHPEEDTACLIPAAGDFVDAPDFAAYLSGIKEVLFEEELGRLVECPDRFEYEEELFDRLFAIRIWDDVCSSADFEALRPNLIE